MESTKPKAYFKKSLCRVWTLRDRGGQSWGESAGTHVQSPRGVCRDSRLGAAGSLKGPSSGGWGSLKGLSSWGCREFEGTLVRGLGESAGTLVRRLGESAGTYVWWLAGRRVTLHTRYFLFICPQCVISTFRPEDTERLGFNIKTRPDLSRHPTKDHLAFRGPSPADPR